jgi:hypothetical protein
MGNLQAPLPEGFISLPVVDFSLSREEISRAILDAGKDIGFFQASPGFIPQPTGGEYHIRIYVTSAKLLWLDHQFT